MPRTIGKAVKKSSGMSVRHELDMALAVPVYRGVAAVKLDEASAQPRCEVGLVGLDELREDEIEDR